MDNAKKKQIKKAITWVLLAALVAGLAAMPLLAKSEAEADGPVATVHTGTVAAGTVTTALHGGGTLVTEDIEDIILPTGVKITEFLVKNGDTVTAGTPLAAVDKVSVMTAITAVTETMEYLQDEMSDAKNEKVSSTISATAGGRIKKVFAQKGDSVQDVMLQHGALALLSLDGLMAVKIEQKTELSTGQTVTVTLSDDTAVNGRVESNLDGVIVITLEDEGYPIGEAVTVTGKDGTEIGTGELYVHNAWTATAYSGTIREVRAKEETKVSAGATLFTLTDTDFKATLEYMASLHREYEELMQDLFKMYNSGIIDAPCAGTISGIDKDSAHLLSAETTDGQPGYRLDLLRSEQNAEEPGWTLVLLSNVVYDQPKESKATACDPKLGETCPAGEDPALHDPSCLKACRKNTTCSATGQHYPECIHSCDPEAAECGGTLHHKPECIKSCTHASILGQCKEEKYPHYLDCIHSCIQSDGTKDCPSTKHKPGCIESCTHGDTADQCTATVHHYPDCIHKCITSDSGSNFCPASKHNANCFFASLTYKARVAMVTDVGSSELIVRWDASGKEYEVENTGSGWKFKGKPDFNTALLVASGPNVTISNPNAYSKGDVIFIITGYRGNTPEWSGVSVYTKASSGGTGLPGGLGGLGGLGGFGDLSSLMGSFAGLGDLSSLMGGLSGFGGYNFSAVSPVQEENKLFDLEGSVLMTVSPEATVSLTISLDEQDIAKVSPGQKAVVKVQALPDREFRAEVVEVAGHGTNGGGSSKFAVKLQMAKAPDMIDGMSATASLPMLTKENIPTIPVMALAEQGSRTVVYTALDEKTQEPSNPVPVTIGISDGTTAEILEGLDLGDPFYYSYYDVVEEDTSVEDRFTLT